MFDFILNGRCNGSVAEKLLACGFQVGCLRPYDVGGKCYLTMNEAGKPVAKLVNNATATLRKDEWIHLDKQVLAAARIPLRLVSDLQGAGLTYDIPNGMGSTVLQSQSSSDPGEAVISMDGLRKGPAGRQEFDLVGLPLPIIHVDFSFSARQIATSRQLGTSLDTSMAEAAGRRVAETVEQLAIGTLTTLKFGGYSLYGVTNHPDILLEDISAATDSGWTPETFVDDILAVKQAAIDNRFYGPYILYTGSSWEQYLDKDFKAGISQTLRERVKKIDGITDVRTLHWLTGFKALLIQLTPDVVRMVTGLPLTTVQWDTDGGLGLNFKVMTIQVPQVRADYNGRTGIVYAS